MSVISIRAFSRFAMQQPVRIAQAGGDARKGLLVELTSDSCRIGGLDPELFTMQDHATVSVGRRQILAGTVRWKGDGMIGLRLDRPLLRAAMEGLLALQGGPLDLRRYGT